MTLIEGSLFIIRLLGLKGKRSSFKATNLLLEDAQELKSLISFHLQQIRIIWISEDFVGSILLIHQQSSEGRLQLSWRQFLMSFQDKCYQMWSQLHQSQLRWSYQVWVNIES
ncbi:unnamed protein product [Blepharisma stoltei]|uniref:Uncharacterized protein n=1 Tax=Blepharisma stoltei TaxID=1481888 RepID=A0AAU9KFM5_9CILI|nr:unnamed protein product [Blepharisma stoltei]